MSTSQLILTRRVLSPLPSRRVGLEGGGGLSSRLWKQLAQRDALQLGVHEVIGDSDGSVLWRSGQALRIGAVGEERAREKLRAEKGVVE